MTSRLRQYLEVLSLSLRGLPDTFLGCYYYQTGSHVVFATADSSNAARWYLINPSATVKVRLMRVAFSTQHNSVLATPTAPRIRMQRFTYTGTPSGAAITPAKGRVGHPAASASLRTAITGMSITPVAEIHAFMVAAALTAVGGVPDSSEIWESFGQLGIELAQNEGIMLDQPDNATTSDTRKFVTSLVVEEHTG